ncbi:uncharacterized protein LOC126628341 isoform X3 [Malus sylvestris]|uniref:uncharacterized protein LOC126628341 isoform X3 n=1 Tax=Malus sylvestris TaxID=3752 RepID=UPI0021AC38E6|nr:uncharacterized protein LOC126628341 isoform X3 [Malus sylvestris]
MMLPVSFIFHFLLFFSLSFRFSLFLRLSVSIPIVSLFSTNESLWFRSMFDRPVSEQNIDPVPRSTRSKENLERIALPAADLDIRFFGFPTFLCTLRRPLCLS